MKVVDLVGPSGGLEYFGKKDLNLRVTDLNPR